MSPIYILSYILVPIAFVMMLKNYQTTNWLWLGFLLISLPIGVGPFIALAYLFASATGYQKDVSKSSKITYNADGSYTVYKAEDTKAAPSAGRLAFRIVGGLIAGATMAVGLIIVGAILLFTLAPSIACGGSSKCM